MAIGSKQGRPRKVVMPVEEKPDSNTVLLGMGRTGETYKPAGFDALPKGKATSGAPWNVGTGFGKDAVK